MGYVLAKKVQNLSPYEPITGQYAIRLDANESFFNLADPDTFSPEAEQMRQQTMDQIKRGLAAAAFNRYPDPFCTELRAAFARRYNLNPDLVTAGNGSDELISIILGGLLEKGTRLVTMSEDFSMYRFGGHLYEHENILYQKPEDLAINPDDVIGFLKEKDAGALVFSNPCNPTSLLLKQSAVLQIVKAVPKTLVVVDEAYMEFCSDESVMSFVETYDNLIVLKTCSKALGLAGVRLGFAIAGEKITGALAAIKPPYNICSMAQAVGTAVLDSAELCDWCAGEIVKSKNQLQGLLETALASKASIKKIYPSSTNFIWVQTPAAGEILNKLKERGIIIRQMGQYLRITAGTKTENEKTAEALNEIVR